MSSGIRSESAEVGRVKSDPEVNGLSLGELYGVLLEQRWLIVSVFAIFLLSGLLFNAIRSPSYRADGLVQVEEKSAGLSALKDLQPLLGGDENSVSAEIEILSSRMVLGKVVEKLKLDQSVTPAGLYPLGGGLRGRDGDDKALFENLIPILFTWSGESVRVESLVVPDAYLDKPMQLLVKEDGSFRLEDSKGGRIGAGHVGKRLEADGIELYISSAKVEGDAVFNIVRKSRSASIDDLRKNLTVKERGKKSGIIEVGFVSDSPTLAAKVLDEILIAYVRQNVEKRSAEAESTLRFLDAQLPDLKKQLDSAEAAYNEYRQSRGSLDLSIETQSVLQSIVDVDNKIVSLKQERDELRQGFTEAHPRIQAIDQKLLRLKERRSLFDSEVGRLPDTQQRILQLTRDVEVSTKLYTDLLNTAQQLRVTKAGTVGDVRIIDPALEPRVPIGLSKAVILLIAGAVGAVVGSVLAFIRRALRTVVETPDAIESGLALPVYATIPHSELEVDLAKRSKHANGCGILALLSPQDDAVESVRGLRTTVHFAMIESNQKSILITGPSPSVGKSFVSRNLGVVLAQSGQRVVIVDADLRKGHIHKEFGLSRNIGVSEYVLGNSDFESVLKGTEVPGLSVITTGYLPPNPSELLMHSRFEALIDTLHHNFDMLIVDAPPILAVSDAAIVGRFTTATLMVVRAGMHPLNEIEQAVRRLAQAGVVVKGFVFNDLSEKAQKYRHGYQGYVYQYKYDKK